MGHLLQVRLIEDHVRNVGRASGLARVYYPATGASTALSLDIAMAHTTIK